ncbi:cell division control protein [Conidiobolus coronatus NRRL 28638]|uniref:Cell division control protein n=1 Tax=Conidiobolus coronatus (strain ATCC 28846 / CBS 209.66 / NRRL 28638) TaxID=796925 RepID=A0A137P3V5_CONC2|nr:cell division control protein [Conidiobolus coronatus NRRL 28638]|eukprot:KXN69700.1 cell division control protein [Conidiobolus coronatus NRRL 28638]
MTENFEDVQLPTSIPTIRTNSIRKLEETPWFLKPDYDPDHIVIVDNIVKGGTLNALIERLTSHDHLDTSFIMTFLLTYRTFTNTVEFLDLLFRRYSLTCPIGLQPDDQELWREKKLKPVRLRVFSVLKTWLESFYLEEEDSRGLENLRHFASTTMSESNTASAGVLMKLVRKRKESSDGQFRKMVRSLREAPTPILPKNLSKFKLLDLDPLEIARQLTIVDSRLYNDLKPVEFLNKAWSRKDNISSPNVTRLIERFNQVNYWVAESILTQHDAKKRCTVIRRFISVAEACAHLNNFSGVMAILAGFNMAPVFRLKRTWDLIAGKPLIILETLKKTMDSSKNFAEYRELLHSVNPPCVPFLGVYLTDLTFNEDGNPNYMPKLPHLINFGKQAKTAEIIREIQGYQNSHYNLDAVAEIQDYLTDQISKAKNLAQLYELSLQMEPKEREDEKIARLLHESGFL